MKTIAAKKLSLLILLLITLSLVPRQQELQEKESLAPSQSIILEDKKIVENIAQLEEWITIFIHGIISVKPYLNIPNVVKFVRDKIANTTYAHTIELTRRDQFFYQHHPMQDLGLHKINASLIQKGAAASAYAQLFDDMYLHAGQQMKNQYYTFGWSGLLSPRMRYLEAKIFYDQLLKELPNIKQKSVKPKIRIVSYSHGGNVALKLAEIYKSEGYKKEEKIIIDELILIGVPILPETDYLINSSIFKKIYHCYSYGDRVQRMDCFSVNRMFSNRIFKKRSDFPVSEKLVQINIRMKRPALTKDRKPQTADERMIAIKKRKHLRTADPGHSELWSFGWTPVNFRKNFPLYPLPLAIIIPYIVSQLQQHLPNTKNISVEVHPSYEQLIAYDFLSKKEYFLPFLTVEQLTMAKEKAELYRPDNFNKKIYNAKINEAKRNGKKRWLSNRNVQRMGHQRFKYPIA
ncbi:MAG: hypothetical protein WDZ41_01055 [Candidatus Babeliales bacterium]